MKILTSNARFLVTDPILCRLLFPLLNYNRIGICIWKTYAILFVMPTKSVLISFSFNAFYIYFIFVGAFVCSHSVIYLFLNQFFLFCFGLWLRCAECCALAWYLLLLLCVEYQFLVRLTAPEYNNLLLRRLTLAGAKWNQAQWRTKRLWRES